jgi:hypothetical protein
MEVHREGLPTAARPGRRSTAVVAGLGGRRRHWRGRRGALRWCGACGGEARGGQWPEMAARVEALVKEPAARRTVVLGAHRGGQVGRSPETVVTKSKESQNGDGGIKEAPTRQRRRQRARETKIAK